MTGAIVLAFGAVSSLGEGLRAFDVGEVDSPPRVAIEHDSILEEAGLLRPVMARARWLDFDRRDRALQLLDRALGSCLAQLERAMPAFRNRRIGIALGTTSGGMLPAEDLFARLAAGKSSPRSLARSATYFGPFEQALATVPCSFSPRVQVLGACASSSLAMGLALRWLRLGRCDIVLAGGYDAISVFVASGFEALRATTSTRPNPFRLGREGLALGEGAAVMALAPASASPSRAIGYIAGFGASTDAFHLTAPDPSGRGLRLAAEQALTDAELGPSEITLVSAHATATPFNDVAEAKAIAGALGGSKPAAVHPFKAQIGHTLGAAGVLESLAALDAMRRNLAPAAAGEGAHDPECAVPLLETNRRLASRATLKLSSAFGGANAALVLTPTPPSPGVSRAPRPVFVRAFAAIDGPLDPARLLEWLAGRHPHVHRLDRMARLALSAVAALSGTAALMLPRGSGVIVGHALATLEQNELFHERLRERGARHVEARRFPATSPNAAAGECAIALRLAGPSFAVGASLHGGMQALGVARDLVASGDAPAMLVVAPDLEGPTSFGLLAAAEAPPLGEGACAALLSAEPGAGAVALEDEVPETLADGSDWTWAAPAGHGELRSYLAHLFALRRLLV